MASSWLDPEDLGDGRTRAAYSLEADPGALLMRFLKGALQEKMRAVLIKGRPAELKARTERRRRLRRVDAAVVRQSCRDCRCERRGRGADDALAREA